jgi:hypothetical protein
VSWIVTFSQAVTGVDAADFQLVAVGLTGSPAITTVAGSGASWVVTASTGSGVGTLGLNVRAGATIVNSQNEALLGGFTGEVYTLDRVAPTCTGITRQGTSPTNAAFVSWTVTFSEPVAGVTPSDFQLVIAGLVGASITSVQGSSTTYVVTAQVGVGTGSLGLNLLADGSIQDALGNPLVSPVGGPAYAVDRVAPTAVTITRLDPSPTQALTIRWQITFSEAVLAVDAADFGLTISGAVQNQLIQSVTGSGSSRIVTAERGTGDGTITLQLLANATITDLLGNAFVGPGLSGPPYTIQTVIQPMPGSGNIRPQIYGFGADTRAAYGSQGVAPIICRVATIQDIESVVSLPDGSFRGSLRSLLALPFPRVIVFEISGTIDGGDRDFEVSSPYLQIATQTAPDPGITIKNAGLNLYTHDLFVQHLRIRPGDGGAVLPQTARHDALLVYDGAAPGDVNNIVIDHCSISWAGAKNVNLFLHQRGRVALWRCLVSEALFHAANIIVDPGQPSSLGLLISGHSPNLSPPISVLQCILAHNSDRNPEIHEGSNVAFDNNLVYDWGIDSVAVGGNTYEWATFFYSNEGPSPIRTDLLSNRYVAGPSSHPTVPLFAVGVYAVWSDTQIRIADTSIDAGLAPTLEYYLNPNLGFDPRVGASVVPVPGYTLIPGSSVEGVLPSRVGARPLNRDSVDTRVIAQLLSRTGQVIQSQNQVGGWPALAVNSRPYTIPANPHSVPVSGEPYTNLERDLEQAAQAVET